MEAYIRQFVKCKRQS